MEKELLDRKSNLKRKILTLEWDKKLRQINFSKNRQLEDYKKELKEIQNKIKQVDN